MPVRKPPATAKPTTRPSPPAPEEAGLDPVWGDLFAGMLDGGQPLDAPAAPAPREPAPGPTPASKPAKPGRPRRAR